MAKKSMIVKQQREPKFKVRTVSYTHLDVYKRQDSTERKTTERGSRLIRV